MAEVFGVAASVAGIVSLGLEVCKGMSTYIDAIRNRDEDLSAINRQIESLRNSLVILGDALPDVDVKHQSAGNLAQAALDSCRLELDALKEFIETLSSPTIQSHTFESNLSHARKKLAFPFHRKRLDTLEKRVIRVHASLDAATCALGLKIISSIEKFSADARTQLSSISTVSTANHSTTTSIKTTLDTAITHTDKALADISNTLASLNASLPDIKQDLNSISEAVSRHEAKSDSLNFAMSTIAVTVANTSPSSELLNRVIRAADILNNLAEKKECDPPYILGLLPEQHALYRLTTSPARLEQVCTLSRGNDAVEHGFTVQPRDRPDLGFEATSGSPTGYDLIKKRYTSDCICQQRRDSIRRYAKLGSLSFSVLRHRRWKHLPECRYAKTEVVSKSDSIGMSFNGLQWLISKAIDVSICLSTGPGSLRMSPSITIRPIVDEQQAPVFKCLRLLMDISFSSYYSSAKPHCDLLPFMEVAMHRVLRQYMSRRSSPYEVNIDGESALHVWVKLVILVIRLSNPIPEEFLTEMTRLLLEVGLPIFLCDDLGRSAGSRLLTTPTNIIHRRRLTSALCKEAPEPSTYHAFFTRAGIISDPIHACWFKTSIGLHRAIEGIELLGCGPLSTAVICGDESQVNSIIAQHPSTVYERNLGDQTPFHFASNRPTILKLLITAANPRELDCPDKDGNYALDYALRHSSTICVEGNSGIACSNCRCTESVDIFLHYHWCRFCDSLIHFSSKMSHTARLKMIDHLVSRRAELKALGQRFLPSLDAARLCGGDESVLDINAHRVAALLLQNGVELRPRNYSGVMLGSFQSSYWGKDCLPLLPITYTTTVYHVGFFTRGEFRDTKLVDLLYEKGFRDIDELDDKGHSPLSTLIFHRGLSSWPSYALWLINHGADILRPFPSYDPEKRADYINSTFTVAHAILSSVIDEGRIDIPPSEIDSFRKLVSLVASLDRPDGCYCQCVETGCHTMKIFFEEIWEGSTGRENIAAQDPIASSSVPKIAEKMSGFLRALGVDLSEWQRVAILALRYFTFEVLGIQHTCCRFLYRSFTLSKDNITEIEDENREKLDLFNAVLQDLQTAYCDFECLDKGEDKLTSFLTTKWSQKMQKVLADMEAIELTEDEKRGAEEIGVRWQTVMEHDDDEEMDMEKMKYWMRKLDEILPDEQWDI